MARRSTTLIIHLTCLVAGAILCLPPSGWANEPKDYSKTILTLTQLHAQGVTAWSRYKAYEDRAHDENHREFARLFAALAASQAVATDRFRRLLVSFGNTHPLCRVASPAVSNTQDNLRAALEWERLETLHMYPEALQRITKEGHDGAIASVKTAIDVQNHHHQKLERIYGYTTTFFGPLTARFNKQKPQYYICTLTGAIVLDRLPLTCPVRREPVTTYIRLSAFETPPMLSGCSPPHRIPL